MSKAKGRPFQQAEEWLEQRLKTMTEVRRVGESGLAPVARFLAVFTMWVAGLFLGDSHKMTCVCVCVFTTPLKRTRPGLF